MCVHLYLGHTAAFPYNYPAYNNDYLHTQQPGYKTIPVYTENV